MNKKDVDFSDGKFEVFIIKMPKSMTELSEILRDLTKGKYDQKYISLTHSEHITFESEEPLSWSLDGEFGGDHKRVAIQNIRKAVEIIRP